MSLPSRFGDYELHRMHYIFYYSEVYNLYTCEQLGFPPGLLLSYLPRIEQFYWSSNLLSSYGGLRILLHFATTSSTVISVISVIQSFQSFSQFSPSITLNTHHAGNIHNPLLRHSIPIHLQKHRITPRAAETIRSVWRTRAAIPWHCSKSPVYLWC